MAKKDGEVWGGVGGWGTHAREVKRGKRYAISEHLYITKTVVTAQRHKEEEDDEEDDGEGEGDTGRPEPDEREEEHDMVKGREGGRSCCFWIFSTRKMHLHLRPAIVHVAKRMFHMVDTRETRRKREEEIDREKGETRGGPLSRDPSRGHALQR